MPVISRLPQSLSYVSTYICRRSTQVGTPADRACAGATPSAAVPTQFSCSSSHSLMGNKSHNFINLIATTACNPRLFRLPDANQMHTVRLPRRNAHGPMPTQSIL
jgi:hypothetical protein